MLCLPALQQPLNIDDWQQHCAQLRDEHAWRYDHPGDAIYAPLLLKQLSDRKPADCIVTTDVGQHQMWAAQHIVHTRPENFITSSGLGPWVSVYRRRLAHKSRDRTILSSVSPVTALL